MRRPRLSGSRYAEAATIYAALPSLQEFGNSLVAQGFVLTLLARVFPRLDGHSTVRLVWRHRATQASVVLTVRV